MTHWIRARTRTYSIMAFRRSDLVRGSASESALVTVKRRFGSHGSPMVYANCRSLRKFRDILINSVQYF